MIAPVLIVSGLAITAAIAVGDWLRSAALEMFAHDASSDGTDPLHSAVISTEAKRYHA